MHGRITEAEGHGQSGWARIAASPGFTLFVLTFTFTIGFVDRQLLNLLVEPVKRDLGLDDVEISLLQGAAFSIAYLLMSPVFGRLVDTHKRTRILLTCAIIWTAFTAGCGLAGSFVMLFAARSIVGGAEAGLTPASWSILTERFDDRRLPRAFSIYHLGTYIGSGLAMVLGGAAIAWVESSDHANWPLIGGMAPWQMTFVLVATLGIPCALLVAALPEPPRGASRQETGPTPPLREAFGIIWKHRSFYIPFYVGMAMAIIPVYAFPAWIPTTAMRQFGVSVSEVGFHYGIVAIVGGSLGVLMAPMFSNMGARLGYGSDVNIRIAAICAILVLVCCAALVFRQSYAMTIVIAGIVGFIYAVPTPLATSALQLATPQQVRGLASGMYIVTITLMGLGVAPFTVAFLTEHLYADPNRVGDSLALVCCICAVISALSLSLAIGPYRRMRDLAG